MHKNLKRLASLLLAGAMTATLSPFAAAEPLPSSGTEGLPGDPMPLSGAVTYYVANSASGGSDLPSKQTGNFAGGGGAGITMEPVAFLVIKNDSVRVMQINAHPGTVDKLVDSFPDMVDKVSGLVKGKKDETPSV